MKMVPCLVEWVEAGEQQHIHWRASARAAAKAIGLKARLNDDEISRILAGVRRQVEWNGWEEPFVTNRFKSELYALNKKSPACSWAEVKGR